MDIFPSMLEHPSLDAEIADGIKSFISKLSAQNIKVKAIDFDLLEYIVPAYYVLTTAEAASNLSRYDGIKYGATCDVKQPCRKNNKSTK